MSNKEHEQKEEQLTTAVAAYIKAAKEIDKRRAKEARELDKQRAKEARELDKQRAKADERRAKEARKLDEWRAKEARKLDEWRAKADEKRAKAADKRDKAAEKRAKEAAEDTKDLKEGIKDLKEGIKDLKETMKETDRRYGSTAFNTGRVTEETFYRALKSDKHIGDITFDSTQRNIHCTDDKPSGNSAELDIVMHNGTYSLIIEVKYLCHRNDVDRFAKKMRKAYSYISKEFNGRKLLFGMAANKFNDDAIEYAHQHKMILFHPDGQKVRADTTACALVHPNTSATPADGTK